MKSIYEQIKTIEQPTGGLINPKNVPYTVLPSTETLHEDETLSSYMLLALLKLIYQYIDSKYSSSILEGQLKYIKSKESVRLARSLIKEIHGTEDQDLINLYKLIQLVKDQKNVVDVGALEPLSEHDIENIAVYINRYIEFVKQLKGPLRHHVRYSETPKVKSDTIELASADGLWDITVSKKIPSKNQFLQLVVEYVIYARTIGFGKIKQIGLFNPKTNIIYKIPVDTLNLDLLVMCEKDILGYRVSQIETKKSQDNEQPYYVSTGLYSPQSTPPANDPEGVIEMSGLKVGRYYNPKKETFRKKILRVTKKLAILCVILGIGYLLMKYFNGFEALQYLYDTQIKPIYTEIINFMKIG